MKRALLVLLLVAASGCYSMRFHYGKRTPEAGAPREKWVHTFFGGLWQPEGPIKLDDMCPQGVASIEQEVSVPNWAVAQLSSVPASIATYPLYNNNLPGPAGPVVAYSAIGRHIQVWDPWTVRVVCSRGALKQTKIAVVTLQPRGGISSDTAHLFTDALIAELRRQPGVTVLAEEDIAAAIGLERQKQLLGCTENSSCLSEIGGALGVDRLVHGSVGRVGESLVVTLTSLDPVHSRAVASVSERLKGGKDEAFLDALPGIVAQLMMESLGQQK